MLPFQYYLILKEIERRRKKVNRFKSKLNVQVSTGSHGLSENKGVEKLGCRTCLRTVKNTDYYRLYDYKHPMTEDRLDTILKQICPEMDLKISADPVVCQKCYSIIEEFINFRIRCRHTEQMIKKLSNTLSKKTSSHFVDLSSLAREDGSSDSSSENQSQNDTKPKTQLKIPVSSDHCYANVKPTSGSLPNMYDTVNLINREDSANLYKKTVCKKRLKRAGKHCLATCSSCGLKNDSRFQFISCRQPHRKWMYYCYRCWHRGSVKRKLKTNEKWEKRKCKICKRTLSDACLFNRHMYRHHRQAYKEALSLLRKPKGPFFEEDSLADCYKEETIQLITSFDSEALIGKGDDNGSTESTGSTCPYCKKKFQSNLEYVNHVRWHKLLPQVACLCCKTDLFVQRIQSEKTRLCEYNCTQCKKRYVVEFIHIQTPAGNEICDK